MNAQAYYRHLRGIIGAESLVTSTDLALREIDRNECYVRGMLYLVGGCVLYVAEYAITEPEPPSRIKCRYQLLDSEGSPLRRWDNGPHHRNLPSFPDHWHGERDAAHPSGPMSLDDVLREVEFMLR